MLSNAYYFIPEGLNQCEIIEKTMFAPPMRTASISSCSLCMVLRVVGFAIFVTCNEFFEFPQIEFEINFVRPLWTDSIQYLFFLPPYLAKARLTKLMTGRYVICLGGMIAGGMLKTGHDPVAGPQVVLSLPLLCPIM